MAEACVVGGEIRLCCSVNSKVSRLRATRVALNFHLPFLLGVASVKRIYLVSRPLKRRLGIFLQNSLQAFL